MKIFQKNTFSWLVGEEWEDIEYRGNYEDEDGENPFGLEVDREITFFGKHTD